MNLTFYKCESKTLHLWSVNDGPDEDFLLKQHFSPTTAFMFKNAQKIIEQKNFELEPKYCFILKKKKRHATFWDVSVFSHVVVLICCYKELCVTRLFAFRVKMPFSNIPPQACFNRTWQNCLFSCVGKKMTGKIISHQIKKRIIGGYTYDTSDNS